MRPEIAFFDIDGTLVEMGTGKMKEGTLHALQKLQENGTLLVISTGRSPVMVPKFEGLNFDAVIAYNGAWVKAGEEIIYTCTIPEKDVLRIIRNCENHKKACVLSTDSHFYGKNLDPQMLEYFGFSFSPIEEDPDFEEHAKLPILQMMATGTKEESPMLMEGADHARWVAWWDQAADIVSTDCSKGNAVKQILEHYQIPKENSIAFGDGENDISMLEEAGLGLAMENASEEVKKAADRVIGHVKDEGVRLWLEQEKLI